MVEFYASGYPALGQYKANIIQAMPNRLLSLHGSYIGSSRKWLYDAVEVRDTKTMSVMFDSGAFTAWSKNESALSVKELLRIYKSALKYCEAKFKAVWFISLDVIPGSPGRTATSDEIVTAIRQSDENHLVLKAELGNRVLPVFHQSEPLLRLQEVVSLNPEYICVSPRNDIVEKYRIVWSQRVHAILKGIKTHGLAATGETMMLTIPWFSVDSASWVMTGAYGAISSELNGQVRVIQISKENPNKRAWFKHYDTLSNSIKQQILAQCEELKLEIEALRSDPAARCFFNVATIARVSTKANKLVPVPQTLFEL